MIFNDASFNARGEVAPMRILKFGGTSVAGPDRIEIVVGLVRQALGETPVAVVVSALGGVTNSLVAAAASAARGDDEHRTICDQLETRHVEAVRACAAPAEQAELTGRVAECAANLRDLCRGVTLVRECSPRTLDGIMSHGERLSALIVAAAMRRAGLDAAVCDARMMILTDETFGNARVLQPQTDERIRAHFASRKDLQVVTGFIGATASSETTTLGRGGSDYTAALLGAALSASCIEIWTDVDGVMSADPRMVPEAFSLDQLSYDELMELSHFGAKVIYPPTVHPARSRSIPLVIRNTLNPSFAGTNVTQAASAGTRPIRGISSISRVALMRLQGDGMVGVPGIAMRLFGALARDGISVILISQASSEHSICFAVAPEAAARARERIAGEFALERRAGLIDDLVVEDDLSIIAAVGVGMRERPGIAGRLFGVLGSHGINVRAISQGSSELNISLATSRADEARALNAIHGAFFSQPRREGLIFLAGAGRVGGALLDQIHVQSANLRDRERIDLRVCGILTSRTMVLETQGIDLSAWRDRLARERRPADIGSFITAARSRSGPLPLFVDCTASESLPPHYEELVDDRVPVIAANKRAFAGPLSAYRALQRRVAETDGLLLHRTTVGAGLPILGTLRDLVRTGDRIERIEGILSGTLAFLTQRLVEGAPFNEAVREAHARGFTEPDPRDDLDGQDVARKLVIMARAAGFPLETETVEVEPLLTGAGWDAMPLSEFWEELPRLDAGLADRFREAAASGERLCYLASLARERARVGLTRIGADHPCAGLTGPDNLVAFHTSRYKISPLLVRGPGAGPEVTAAGVFADILQALASAGHP